VDEYAYDKADQVTEVSMKKKAEVLASMTYTRDKLGQIEKSVDTGFSEEAERKYEYDAANRLTKSNGTLFTYDKANNVTKISPTTYTYDKADQIATASNSTFEYNKVGQRIKSTPTGGSATTFAYDQAGNLIKNVSGGVENTFKYDGTGLRTTETRGASTYPMVWDSTPGLPLMLRKGADYFIYGPEGVAFEQITSGVATYLHHDQLGSIRVLTKSNGEVTGTYRYGPNGAVWKHTGTGGTMMGFAGQPKMHTENQLMYLRARTYDPVTAQFLSPDPLASGETYAYAAANPVSLTDPSGLCSEDPKKKKPKAPLWGRCISVSIGSPDQGISDQVCFVIGYGEIGITSTKGRGTYAGLGGSVGYGPLITNATTTSDLGKKFTYAGGGGGETVAVGAGIAWGSNDNGEKIVAFTPWAGLGVGLPMSLEAGTSWTETKSWRVPGIIYGAARAIFPP